MRKGLLILSGSSWKRDVYRESLHLHSLLSRAFRRQFPLGQQAVTDPHFAEPTPYSQHKSTKAETDGITIPP